MISVIVCSRDKALLSGVSKNVGDTIGVPYELIAMDNAERKRGICEVYNEGAAKSRFDILCFMHEDVRMQTEAWGKRIVEILTDPSIGILGVAGSTLKTRTPSPWWEPDPSAARSNILQHYPGMSPKKEYHNPHNEMLSGVVVVDGVWFCCRKEVWQNNRFDETHFRGFHFYDLDFSLQVFRTMKVCVCYDILLEHLSAGTINKGWTEAALVFHEKWEKQLPLHTKDYPEDRVRQMEQKACKNFLSLLLQPGYSKQARWQYWVKCMRQGTFDREAVSLTCKVLKNLVR